jgi:hypothetical protein
MAPDRWEIQSMKKKDLESFKEYAQRWRETAAQVQPPLPDRETVTLFIDILGEHYYKMMIGNVSSSFPDIVMTGERIEAGIRSGKITLSTTSNTKKPFNGTGKKWNTNVVIISPPGLEPFQPNHPLAYINYPSITTNSPISSLVIPYFMTPPQSPHTSATQSPQPNQTPYQKNSQSRKQNSQERKPVHFDPIPVSYTELLPPPN